MIVLGTLGGSTSVAVAVSDGRQVVGSSYSAGGEVHAFSWTEAGGMIDLGTFGGFLTFASAVNASGQVVGWSELTVPKQATHAFWWTQAVGGIDVGHHRGRADLVAP